MIVFLTLVYVGLLFALTKTGKVPNTKGTWLTIVPYELVLIIGFLIPMQWGAPSGDVRAVTYSVSIVPNVNGVVTEVPIEANEALKKGDVLFRIDPTQYQAALDTLRAQLALAETRVEQSKALVARGAGSVYELQAFEAQVDGLAAQIENAEWNLRETVVRAPADGFVTNLALRPGVRVTNLPLAQQMAFIDTSEIALIAQIHQIHTRYIESGQKAEVTFKTIPGEVFPATVRWVVPATSEGQAAVTGMAYQPAAATPGPFAVRLRLDDPAVEAQILPGALGTVAIYTDNVRMAHVIRKVMIRMDAIMNYVSPM